MAQPNHSIQAPGYVPPRTKALITGMAGLDGSYVPEQVATTVGFEGAIDWDTSKPDGTPKKQLNVERLQAMGWRARIALEDGLKLAYVDFQAALAEQRLRG